MLNVHAGSLITRDPFSGRRDAVQTMTYYYYLNYCYTLIHSVSHIHNAYIIINYNTSFFCR